MKRTSEIPGFHKMNREKRLMMVQEFAGLTDKEVEILRESLQSFELSFMFGKALEKEGGEG